MIALRSFVVASALTCLFASSLAHADDCSDALIAESCACRSAVRSEQELRSSDKASARRSKASRGTGTKVAQRAKKSVAAAEEINSAR
jgi:hypothetical protein